MHPASTNQPTQSQLIFPLLSVMEEHGGRAHARDVADELASQFQLSGETTAATIETRDGQIVNLWRRHVRFAAQKAKAMGYLQTSPTRGEWQLTKPARTGLQFAQPAVVVEIL